ncbi:hypothetical protein niasHS_006062 [Heterodera schachtii]|uniref:ISXO2-like transposase domain-containing protein n=1 Tax=Heterodera schachtii TaxID=97005 RepID=A0ABD2JVY5_HETSC
MTQVKNPSFPTDNCQWRCPSHKGQKVSIRAGSFFENAHFELHKGMLLAYSWALGIALHTQTEMIVLKMHALIDWANFFRGICSRWLIDNPIRLGGVGHVIQIDESVLARRKYHRGHRVREIWIFGLYDVHAGIGVVRIVPDRTRATLLPIIEEYVLPGSTIHSDQWAAYMGGAIPSIPVIPPYIHHSVNHTINFVDPITSAHTNHVECFWKNLKMKFKAMSGTSRELLPSYCDEYMWRQLNGKKTLDAFENIVEQIAHYYPVNA